MIKFITKHPYMTVALCVALACLVFGPDRTGMWIAVHGRQAIVGAWRFVRAFFQGAF